MFTMATPELIKIKDDLQAVLDHRPSVDISTIVGKDEKRGVIGRIEPKVEIEKNTKIEKFDRLSLQDYLEDLKRGRNKRDSEKIDLLIFNIKEAISDEEIKSLLQQANKGVWDLPKDPEVAKGMLVEGTNVSIGPDDKKSIGALIGDEDYKHLSSLTEIENNAEPVVEDHYVWKRTLNNIIRKVKSLSDSVIGKREKAMLLYELTGADRKKAAEALRGAVPSDELHKFEDVFEKFAEEENEELENDPDTTNIPVKKQSSIIEFPGKKKVGIDGESFHDDLEEKYGNKEEYSLTAENMLRDREENRDGIFANEAKKFYADGDIGNALASVERIIDRGIQSQVVHEIIVECQKNQDIYNIKKFIGKLKDVKYKETLTNWLNSEMKLVVDPIESRVPTEDMSLNKPEPVSPYGDKSQVEVQEEKTETVPEIDLPLNINVPNIVDAGEVVLDKGETIPEEPRAEVGASPETVFVNEKVENKNEASGNREVIQAELDKARDDYAREYIDWEYKTRHSKTMFKKTMASLGSVVKTMPDKFSLKTTALEDAQDEYNKAKEKAGEIGLVAENKVFLNERFNLDDRMQFYREEKEAEYKKEKEEGKKKEGVFETRSVAETIKKGLAKWPNLSRQAKVAVSAVLLTGGMISTVGDIGKGFDGLRTDRAVAGDTNRKGNEDIPDVSGPAPEKGAINPSFEIKTPEAIRPVEVKASSKGFIKTLENLQDDIKKVYGTEDKIPEEIKKTLIDESAVELAKKFDFYDPEHNKSGVIKEGESLGLDSYGNVVLASKDGGRSIVFDTKTGLALEFGGKKVADKVSVEVVENNVTEKIPYKDSFVEVVKYDGGNEVIKYNDQEIAKSYDLNGEKAFALEDKYQDGIKFADIRGAFSEYLKNNPPKNLALPEPINFAGGTIYLVRDSVLVNKVSAILNGKLIGTADLTKRVKKIDPLKGLKSGWFELDNVYDLACKEGTKVLPRISVV